MRAYIIYNKVWMMLLLMAVSLLSFMSCSGDDGEDAAGAAQTPIDFSVTLEDEDATRGARVTDVSQVLQMGVSAQIYHTDTKKYSDFMFYNLKVSRTSGTDAWTYTPAYYWPGVAEQIRFVAYSPYASDDNGVSVKENSTGEVPSVVYNTPIDLDKQPDLLGTGTSAITSDATKAVSLSFHHLLSSHRFIIANNGDGSKASVIPGLSITKIEFYGIYTQGTFTYSFTGDGDKYRANWTDLSNVASRSYGDGKKSIYTTVGSEAEEGTEIISDGMCFMLLPQTVPSGAYMKVTATYNGAEIAEKKSKIDLSSTVAEWKGGRTYTYGLTFSGNGIKFVVTESAWMKKWGQGDDDDHSTYNW